MRIFPEINADFSRNRMKMRTFTRSEILPDYMDVSLFIAKRLRFKGKVAALCITVSFLVVIVAVAVSSGFRNEIREGLSSFSGDVRLTPVDMNPVSDSSPVERNPSYLAHISSLPGVKSIVPVVYRAGIVKHGENIHGVILKGTEQGDSLGTLGVSIPSALASMMGLREGDDMLTYFVGENVRVRKFKVRSVYDGILDVKDKLVVYAGISDLQRVNGWDRSQVSALEVMLEDRYRTVSGMNAMADEIGFIAYNDSSDDEEPVVSSSAVEMYPQLFDWLILIGFDVLFILLLMTIVAGFNMISGLLIMLFENISTIGLLKALGMTDRSIAKVFLASSSVIVFKGMVLGNLIALALCAVQGTTRLISLNPANYFVSYVPVHIDLPMILLADAAVYCIIMLLLLIPSLFIARVDPVRTVSVR